jgi:hypothetical protein
MKIGTVVTYGTRNPLSSTSRIGVVVPGESDWGSEYVLIAEGVFTVGQAKNSDCTIISRRSDELTPVAPSIVAQLVQ